MIEVKELSKKFGDFWALKNTSWKVEEKRALGLLGPNGAGKSTTMKIMTGLLCSTEGQVLIDGEDVFKYPIEAKRKIGFLPETPPVYEDLNVWSYLDFICGLKSVPRKQRKSQIEDAIDKMSLSEVAHKYIGSLSKGFRQRVGIAQSLIGSPAILILDEPSVGLDPHQVYELRNIIKDLKSDHTIVLSTHVLSEVQQICDDVVIIDKGEIKTQGSLDLIISQ
ncbi:MAG: ABC transporter ATP-binding protein, partial [Bdellovibrionales bacterium]|nr:ABC transporter ATP-binding protein [Bdellovibrionales bacterium]